MCGFVGYLNLSGCEGQNSFEREKREKQNRALLCLTRRGPDAEGDWSDENIWLGHRRLSVIDLDARSNQPMHFGQFALVFNGMIYNFQEIRVELEAKGCLFKTNSDTEVLLQGWATWKDELFARLDGMFALAIWDSDQKILTLARDRYGKKPLFYREWRGDFVFASNLDAVEAMTESLNLDSSAVSWLLTLKYLPDHVSVCGDVNKLSPGEMLEISFAGVRVKKWHKHSNVSDDFTHFDAAAQDTLFTLLESSVSKRMISDVPMACFLSGGLDSAIIAGLASRKSKINTFTAVFNDKTFNEGMAARATALYLGSNHNEVILKEDDQMNLVRDLFTNALDEPFGDSSALASLAVCKAIKGTASVALSGDGADEVFGGYDKHKGEVVLSAWRRLPRHIKVIVRLLFSSMPSGRNGVLQNNVRKFTKFAVGADLPAVERHALWMTLLANDEGLERYIGREKQKELMNLISKSTISSSSDTINEALMRDLQIVLVSDMLVKVDRTSMFSGVEVRSPFLDHSVVEFSKSISGAEKVSWKSGKIALRKTFGKLLPPHVKAARKRGFEIPLTAWLQGPLNSMFKKAVSPDFLQYINVDTGLGNHINDRVAAGDFANSELAWTLMSIYHWCEKRNFTSSQ